MHHLLGILPQAIAKRHDEETQGGELFFLAANQAEIAADVENIAVTSSQ